MFRSLVAAEKAALEGQNQDFDTQKCIDLQDEFLSSSPTNAPDHGFPFSNNVNSSPPRPDTNGDGEVEASGTVEKPQQVNGGFTTLPKPPAEPVRSTVPTSVPAPPGNNAVSETRSILKKRIIRRNSDGQLRASDEAGNEFPAADESELERERKAAVEATEAMESDDLTQKSAMSLTQENPPSAYDQFNIQKHIRDDYPSTATPDDGDVPENLPTQHEASLHSRQYASTKTNSTTHTYEENDSRYIHLEFEPSSVVADAEPEDEDEDGGISQDPSFALPQFNQQQSYEPQTPAPPQNPFHRKGSVLKPSQMFGATQPSSVGRRVSPTSSRPSPDVYNDFSSPPKRSRLHSSPLAARNEVNDDTSPLQSSVRHMLARSTSALTELPSATKLRTSGVQSFDAGPRIQRSGVIEPRPYMSMKESQERRNDLSQSDSGSDSDSSIDARSRKRLERERRIRQELSTIGRIPTSSRPSSASAVEIASTGRRQSWQEELIAQHEAAARAVRNSQDEEESSRPGSAAVEVPSTGRRRSWQEDYVAQCEGRDARDTQPETLDTQEEGIRDTPQEDVVADSQTILNQEEEPGENHPSLNGVRDPSAPEEDQPGRSMIVSQQQPVHQDKTVSNLQVDATRTQPQVDLPSEQGAANASAATASAPEPSLPLQELSSNKNNLRTPMAKKIQPFSDGLETVPETSPPERSLMGQRSPQEEPLRPMGEIANISFGADGNDDMSNLPGFTQDVDFENAMRIRSSPQPPPRVTVRNVPSAQVSEAVVVSSKPALAIEGKSHPVDASSVECHQQAAPLVEELGNAQSVAPGAPSDHAEEGVATEQQTQNGRAAAHDGEKGDAMEDSLDSAENDPAPLPSTRRTGLRSKNELKGPSRALRRSESTSRSNTPSSGIPKQAQKAKPSGSRSAKHSSAASISILAAGAAPLPPDTNAHSISASFIPSARTPSANPPSPTRSSKRKAGLPEKGNSPAPLPKRITRRKSGPTVVDDSIAPTRSSKRQSIARDAKEDSEDPLALPIPATSAASINTSGLLFANMAFAVSYQKREQEKDEVMKVIRENGGRILEEGFDILFETSKHKELDAELMLSASNKSLGFSALIADEHSRKAKYMQALALGLPCISGQWVLGCVRKGAILDWSPYLLCAGQSSFLGNVMKSRVLPRYPAAEANLETTLDARDKLLYGKSVLMVTSRGKVDKRRPYVFLTRALGALRVGQVGDLSEACTKLGSDTWDLLYTDSPKDAAAAAVFGSGTSSGGSKKRKRGPTVPEDSTPLPKRICVIDDETMIQSLILGQIMEA